MLNHKGVKMLEKTITFDKTLNQVEHYMSLEINELQKFVKNIRSVEESLGSPDIIYQSRVNNDARRSLVAKIDIKKAIGTSLVIVTLKSLIGFFLGDALTMNIDWEFLLTFSAIAIVGIFFGTFLNNLFDGQKLRKGFGYFILLMAGFIFYMEFLITST